MLMNEIIVLHAPLPRQWAREREIAVLDRLPYAKRLELDRAAPRQRLASLCGIVLAEAGITRLCGIPRLGIGFEFPQQGKPALPGGPDFSISHCEGRVACAVSASSIVGLDVEHESLVRERTWLQRWTATEAVLKAAGIGLRSAADVRIDATAATIDGQEPRFILVPLALADGFVACLACSRKPDPLVVVEVRDLL